MAGSKGKRITALKEAKEIPAGSNFLMELPNGGNSRRVTRETLTKEIYRHLQYGTDADVDAIIAGTYEDPKEDNWEEGEPSGGGETEGDNTGGSTTVDPDNDNIATDQEVEDYLNDLNLFED